MSGSTTDNLRLLDATPLLDWEHPSLQRLVVERRWRELDEYHRVGAIYDFVRNEIRFGYNTRDDLPASRVLTDGIGQCNTKGILLMALLRATGVPCRIHGFTIDKALQKGAITGLAYFLAPRNIVHSWIEVWFENRWIELEGFILDAEYLSAVRDRYPDQQGSFCGFGLATTDFQNPPVSWKGCNTYIQKEGINQDFGVFATPDEFYRDHGTNLSGIRKWLFEHVFRSRMNATVRCIRGAN